MLKKILKNHFDYLNTVRELNTLTERELGDIGISKFDIKRLAREHTAKK
jgi:uncharacterized protein YjiS (DUF1127 family)